MQEKSVKITTPGFLYINSLKASKRDVVGSEFWALVAKWLAKNGIKMNGETK